MNVVPASKRLPDEILMDILRHSPPDDFARLRLVDRQWSRVASDPIVQRDPFAPLLLEPCVRAQQLRSAAPLLTRAQTTQFAAHAHGLFRSRRAPQGCGPKSWMQLVQQARHVEDIARTHARAQRCRTHFESSIWSAVMVVVAATFMLSGVLHDQGTINQCPELVAAATGVSIVAFLLIFCLPVIWLVYNLLGVAAEEFAAYYAERLERTLDGPCADIAALLQTLA